MKKVLITGANGFLATHIIKQLGETNYPIRAMVRQTSDTRVLASLNIDYELIFGDIRDKNALRKATKSCDIVIHTAAITAQNASWRTCQEVNIEGTKNVLEAAKKAGAKQFIFVSTANAIGNRGEKEVGTEEMPFMEWLKASPYAYTKYQAQQLVLAEATNADMLIQVVNPTFMIGSHDGGPSSGRLILMNHNKRFRLCPPGGKNFVAVGDVAQGIIPLIGDTATHGESFLLAGKNYSYRAFFNLLDQFSDRKSTTIYLPQNLVKWSGFIAEKTIPNSSLNRVNARMLCTYNYYDASKAIEQIGLPQTPIETAIQEALDWFAENDYL